jgi:hypothetical protein
MLVGDWTGQLARERVAELHRQAGRQRLVRLARARRDGGNRSGGRGWRLQAGPLSGSGKGPHGGTVDQASHSSIVSDAMRSS